jgi:hypothetical protein
LRDPPARCQQEGGAFLSILGRVLGDDVVGLLAPDLLLAVGGAEALALSMGEEWEGKRSSEDVRREHRSGWAYLSQS